MSSESKSKKKFLKKFLIMVFSFLLGAGGAIIIVSNLEVLFESEITSGEVMLINAFYIVSLFFALIVQIIIHEAGHLVFGLLTGYKFSSFRIFSFMLLKENNKFSFKKLKIPGTAGQCLMVPPNMKDGKIPVILYNLGGSFMNIISALIFAGLYFLFDDMLILSTVMLTFAVVGVLSSISNGIPMRVGNVDNDGYNAYSLTRNPQAMRAFWVQMKVNEQVSKGVRLRDMPDEWFVAYDDEAMKNSMVATVGVLTCNRLMDAGRFEEADNLMAHMLEIDCGMVGLHRNLVVCDRIYLEIISNNRRDVIDTMLDKRQKKFMKHMKALLSVIRTEYAYALLCEKDLVKSEKLKNEFEKFAKIYPYESDLNSERELLDIVDKISIAYGK